MNPSVTYFKDLFAATVAQQVSLFLPLVVENKCGGCRLGGDHDLCHLSIRALVDACFTKTLTLLDKDNAETQFRSYLYPRPAFVLDEAWFQGLWADDVWLQLVRDKLVQLRECVADH